MVDQGPRSAIPFEAVGTGGEVTAIEQRPDQAIGLEHVGQRFSGLEKLVTVIEPSGANQLSHGKDRDGLKQVFVCYEKTAGMANTVNGGEDGGLLLGVLQIVTAYENVPNRPV